MKRANNIILLVLMTLISLPITLLLLGIGLPAAFYQLYDAFNSDNAIIALMLLCSIYAVLSLWWLVISHIRHKNILSKNYLFYWAGVLVGFIISGIGFISTFLPKPDEYTEGWWFYDQVHTFIFGVPLGIPAIHLFLSAWFVKRANCMLNSTPLGAGSPKSGIH